MTIKTKVKIGGIVLAVLMVISLVVYFKYFFTYEERQVIKRRIDTVTGLNLTVTVFGFDGKIIRRWVNIRKITSGRVRDTSGERNYTYFYTQKGKYVQIPDSVWYIAEEE